MNDSIEKLFLTEPVAQTHIALYWLKAWEKTKQITENFL